MVSALDKPALRQTAKARRADLARACPDFAQRIARQDLGLSPAACVAGYAAIGGEADPSALLRALEARGHVLALPRVAAKAAPLEFHAWREGEGLHCGAYGIAEPSADARTVAPDVLLVPLLAFDARGFRLGYGGGYYDRSLAMLRARARVLAIGIAFAGQEVERVPHDARDQPLDAVLTEAGLRLFAEDQAL